MFPLPIALDAMGGDKAPESVIYGAKRALKWFPELRFIFFGDEKRIAPILRRNRVLRDVSEIVHTDERIAMDSLPSQALRKGKKSSMRLAIDAVAKGRACAVVSAGNTGALMAMSKFVYKTLPGIERPAITATMPAKGRDVVMLDLGANVECTSAQLMQFVVMGDAYARALLGLSAPKIGLLNVGSEEMKGHEEVQRAHQHIKSMDMSLDYHGFVEGHDILDGTVDVVVTDGFTGNIALKTAEGAARLIYGALKTAIENSWSAKVGYLFAKPAISVALRKFDPRVHNGAILLGLNGISVKSHGGADAKGFAHAIRVAVKLVEQDINNKIIEELSQTGMTSALSTGELAAASDGESAAIAPTVN